MLSQLRHRIIFHLFLNTKPPVIAFPTIRWAQSANRFQKRVLREPNRLSVLCRKRVCVERNRFRRNRSSSLLAPCNLLFPTSMDPWIIFILARSNHIFCDRPGKIPRIYTRHKHVLYTTPKTSDLFYMYIPLRQHNLLLPKGLSSKLYLSESHLHLPFSHRTLSFSPIHLFMGDFIKISNY